MRHVLSTAVITFSLIVGLAAQGQQPPAQQPSTQPPSAQQPPAQPPAPTPAAAKLTISGCIQTPAAEAPVAGAAPAGPATSKFDLASAKMVGNTPVGTTGAAPAATRYRLEGDEKTISPHLNHQVEITGTVSPATAASVTGATTAAPTFKVESLKMVAAKCAS